MNNLYEALEVCLQDIEKGANLESVLFRYPDLSDELRPILETSAGAKSMAIPSPSQEVVRRNRAKVLQHAAQMRESNVSSSRRIWFALLRRLAVTLAVVAVLFVSGTGLVRAAANTLPGDSLYPVKRTWEDVSLFLTFDSRQREMLEIEHENKRLYETKTLLEEGRSEEVDFNGRVTSQNGNEWVVAGIRVLISNQTEMRDQGISVGDAVRVRGVTQGNDTVLAERIRLLSDDAKLPDAEDGHEGGNGDNSGPGSGDETPESEFQPREESFEGVVVSVENNIVVVNGIEVDISQAEIRGTPGTGLTARVRGYYDANGVFIVTRIEFRNDDSGGGSSNDPSNSNENSGSSDNSGSGGQGGGNDNSNDDGGSNSGSGNGDDGDNNDNGDNSGSGGGDNSGPGGGGGSDEDNSGPGGGGGED